MQRAVGFCLALALLQGVGCSASTTPTAAKHGPSTAREPAPAVAQPPPAEETLTQLAVESESASAPKPRRLGFASLELGPHPPWEAAPFAAPARMIPAAGERPPERWRLLTTVWVGQGYLHHAELSRDGRRVLTLSEQEGSLRAYDVQPVKLRHKVPIPGFGEFDSVGFVSLDDAQTTVLVVRGIFGARGNAPTADPVPLLVNLTEATFTEVPELPAGDGLEATARPELFGIVQRSIEPQSGMFSLWWISLRTDSGGVIALETRLAARLSCDERPDDWALSEDGKLLAIAYYPSNSVELLDLEQRRVLLRLSAPQWGGAVALSPRARLLALGGAELRVHAVPSGDLLARDSSYQNNIDSIRFTPSADLLLTSAYDRKARSYALPERLDTLDALPRPQPLPHSGANVYALGLTPDGRRLVTSSGDQTLKIWVR